MRPKRDRTNWKWRKLHKLRRVVVDEEY